MEEQSVNIEHNSDNDNEIQNKKDQNKQKQITINNTKNDIENKNSQEYKYPWPLEYWNNQMSTENIQKSDSNINNCKQILNYLQKAYMSKNMEAFDLIWQQIVLLTSVLSFYFVASNLCLYHFLFYHRNTHDTNTTQYKKENQN